MKHSILVLAFVAACGISFAAVARTPNPGPKPPPAPCPGVIVAGACLSLSR